MAAMITSNLLEAGADCLRFLIAAHRAGLFADMMSHDNDRDVLDRIANFEGKFQTSDARSPTAADHREAVRLIETMLDRFDASSSSRFHVPAMSLHEAASFVRAYRRAEAKAPQAVPTSDVYVLLARAGDALRSSDAKFAAEIDATLSRPNLAQVYLAIHQSGTHSEARVFSSPAAAGRWREEIADNGWTSVFSDAPRPIERDVMADRYFDRGAYLTVHQAFSVQPAWPDRESGWTPPGGAARIEPQKVWIGLWTNSEGVEARAFSSPQMAEAWRQEIACEQWGDEFPVDVAPEDPAERADEYFYRMMSRNGGEFFDVDMSLLNAETIAPAWRAPAADASPAP